MKDERETRETREKALRVVWERLGTRLPAVDRATREARLFGITSISCRHNEEGAEGVLLAAAAGKLDRLRDLDVSSCYRVDAGALAPLTRLTRLVVNHNDVGRPWALASLTGLRSLDISYCYLNWTMISDALEGLSGLTYLDINHNFLGYHMAGVDMTPLAALTGLRDLNVRSCINPYSLDVVPRVAFFAAAIARLTGLTRLDVGRNAIGISAEELTSLTGLRGLNIGRCELSSLSFLKDLTGLTHLDVSEHDMVKDDPDALAALAALTGLRSLEITRCHLLVDAAETIACLTGLTSLDVSNNDDYYDSDSDDSDDDDVLRFGGVVGIRALTALTGLRALRAHSCGLGPWGAETIASLTRLTFLDVSWNPDLNRDGAADRAFTALTHLAWADFDKYTPEYNFGG